jgi:type II secretory pathway pseudopilin PulG
MTLVEVLLSASLFSVVLLLFAGGMVQMFRSAGRTEALDLTQGKLRLAVQQLDAQIRFASAIAVPAADPAGTWYVAYVSGGTCTELRLTDALQRRTPAGGGTWRTLADGVAAGSGQPFTRVAAGASDSGHQLLELRLVITAGGDRDAAQRERSIRFTALNTSVDTVDPADCAVSV